MSKHQFVVSVTPTEDGCELHARMLVDGEPVPENTAVSYNEINEMGGPAFARIVTTLIATVEKCEKTEHHLAHQANTERPNESFTKVLEQVLTALTSRGVGSNEFPARTETVDTDTDAPARTETVDTDTDAPARTETNDTPVQ